MAKLTRKNLVVDADRLRALADRRGVSESAAVRQAVDMELLAEEFEEAMRELSALGGIDDVFGKCPPRLIQRSMAAGAPDRHGPTARARHDDDDRLAAASGPSARADAGDSASATLAVVSDRRRVVRGHPLDS
jgi:hypothetical protein